MSHDLRAEMLGQHLVPDNEAERLAAIRSLGIQLTAPMPEMQALASLARDVFDCAFAGVNIVDEDWLRIAAQSGIHIHRCSRDQSVCQHVVHEGSMIVVPDLRLDAKMSAWPYVVDYPRMISYAGAPIVLEDGLVVGAFCALDTAVWHPTDSQRRQLTEFARIAGALFRLQRSNILMARAESDLRLAAMTDPMTGFYNRQALGGLVDAEMHRTAASGQSFGAAYLDMDGFKTINDRYGHHFGDEVLRQAAARIRSVMRAGDIPLRMGGDEFVVFFPDCGSEAALTTIAARLVDAFRTPFHIDEIDVMAHLSVGAATAPQGGSCETLLQTVDQALYQAKANGRDRYVVRAAA